MKRSATVAVRYALSALALSFMTVGCDQRNGAAPEAPVVTDERETHAAWAERMMADQYQAEGAREALLSRDGGETAGEIIDVLESAARQHNDTDSSRADIFLFVQGYRPFWQGNGIDLTAWGDRQARIPALTTETVQEWRRALRSFNGGHDMPTYATIALLIGTPSLFGEGGFDTARSTTLLSRVSAVQGDDVERLAEVLRTSNPAAALVLADHDRAFSDVRLNEGEFALALTALSAAKPPQTEQPESPPPGSTP